MPDPDGSMLAWPQVPTLDCCLCLLLSMFHYTHSCASKSGMVHTHVGMPSQACVSISNQAQIKLKSNQIKCYIRSQKLILRHVTRATTTHQLQKMRTNRPHDVAHASVPVIPSRERVDAAPVCSSSRTRDGTASPASPPPFGGEEAGGAREGWRGGLRGQGPPWYKKVGFEALARAKICMPARTQLKGLPGSTACRCVSPFSGHRM